MHLYETHLPVTDTERSARFYVDVVGLEFGHRDPGRDIVFLYVGTGRRSMLGLWGPGTTYGRDPHACHFAIAVALPELLARGHAAERAGYSHPQPRRRRDDRAFGHRLDAFGAALRPRSGRPLAGVHHVAG